MTDHLSHPCGVDDTNLDAGAAAELVTPPTTAPAVTVMHGLRFTLEPHDPLDNVLIVTRDSDQAILHRDLIDAGVNVDDAAETWIRTALRADPRDPARCGNCNIELHPVGGFDTSRTYDDALIVIFDGGYGMHIDPFDNTRPHAIICGNCARSLQDAYPWVAELLAPYR